MKTSEFGATFIRRKEGLRLLPYKDTNGYWTCGVGHKMDREPLPGEVWTPEEALGQLEQDLLPAEFAVLRAITRPMTQPQFDAFVSLAFNIGGSAFSASSVAREHNAGKFTAAADAFTLWSDHGHAVQRRLEERTLYLYGCLDT